MGPCRTVHSAAETEDAHLEHPEAERDCQVAAAIEAVEDEAQGLQRARLVLHNHLKGHDAGLHARRDSTAPVRYPPGSTPGAVLSHAHMQPIRARKGLTSGSMIYV